MDYNTLIAERYSVRKFDGVPLTGEEIDALLAAGLLAPTGCNDQPQRILVLQGDSMEKLRGCTRCHFGAPNAMLVCYRVARIIRTRLKAAYYGAFHTFTASRR